MGPDDDRSFVDELGSALDDTRQDLEDAARTLFGFGPSQEDSEDDEDEE